MSYPMKKTMVSAFDAFPICVTILLRLRIVAATYFPVFQLGRWLSFSTVLQFWTSTLSIEVKGRAFFHICGAICVGWNMKTFSNVLRIRILIKWIWIPTVRWQMVPSHQPPRTMSSQNEKHFCIVLALFYPWPLVSMFRPHRSVEW